MTEHTAFLRLAATAVDFELEPADSSSLARHLEGCDACRRSAQSLRADAMSLAALPRRTPSPQIAAAIARAARGETGSGRSPMLMLGLGFLIVVGLAGAAIGGAAIRQALESDGQVELPSVTPTDAAIVVPSTEPNHVVDPRLAVEWQVVTPAIDGSTGLSVNAVAAHGPGFVAVGRACQGGSPPVDLECWGSVQLSADGLTWESVPRQPGLEIGAYSPVSGPGSDMIGVAAGTEAIVAIGYAVDGAMTLDQGGTFGPAVWRSGDGRTWLRAPDNGVFDGARFSDVVATGRGYAIVGAVYGADAPLGRPRGAIWTSTDGLAWTRVADGPVFDIGGYQDTGEDPGSGGPGRVIVAGGTILAVGAVCDDRGLNCVTAFWSSQDGSSWDRVTLAESNVVARDVAATADGFVAVGMASNTEGCGLDLHCIAAVFTSPDGRTWLRQQIEIPVDALPPPYAGSIAPDGFSDVVVAGGRIIAAADEVEPDEPSQAVDEGRQFWWSTDGTVWNPYDGSPDDLDPAHWQPMAVGADRLVIVGELMTRAVGQESDVWTRMLVSPPQ